jgi:DNA-directed RNA polymerase subunit RPC12/RpoP
MCESTYAGCANCGATTESMTFWCDEQRREYAHVDEHGDMTEFFDSSDGDTIDSGYSCSECGSENTSVDPEREPDECDCAECDPKFVLLRRTSHLRKPDLAMEASGNVPEIRELFADRARTVVPISADKALDLYANVGLPPGVEVDLTTAIPDYLLPEEAAA